MSVQEADGVKVVVRLSRKVNLALSAAGSEVHLFNPEGAIQAAITKKNINDGEPETSNAQNVSFKSETLPENVLQITELSDIFLKNNKYAGEKISLEFANAPVIEVISYIAKESGANLIVSDRVSGNITIKLRDIPWDQSLSIILKSKNLGYVREGNILRISTLDEISAAIKSQRDLLKTHENTDPLILKVLRVSYLEPSEAEAHIKGFLNSGRGESVKADKGTNTLIVKTTKATFEKVEEIISVLDVPPKQVLIESKIIEAREDFQKDAGVRWNVKGASYTVPGVGVDGGDAVLRASNLSSTPSYRGQKFGQLDLSFGTLDFLGNLNVFLSIAEAQNKVRVYAVPRIVTMNKSAATITQSGQIVTVLTGQVSGSDNTTQTETRTSYSMNFGVTPQITANNGVILDVNISRSYPGAQVGDAAPPIESRSVKTKMLVDSGQTAVIGGLYQDDNTFAESGIPYLKDIPVLGWFFKGYSESRNKSELMIFITPRVLDTLDTATDSFHSN